MGARPGAPKGLSSSVPSLAPVMSLPKVSKIYIVIHAEKHICNQLRLKIGKSGIFSGNSCPG